MSMSCVAQLLRNKANKPLSELERKVKTSSAMRGCGAKTYKPPLSSRILIGLREMLLKDCAEAEPPAGVK